MGEDIPPKCPACDSRLPLERVGTERFFCPCCAREFAAVRDRDAWRFDLTPLRKSRRISA